MLFVRDLLFTPLIFSKVESNTHLITIVSHLILGMHVNDYRGMVLIIKCSYVRIMAINFYILLITFYYLNIYRKNPVFAIL